MSAWVDFTPLLGRIVRLGELDPRYAQCVPVWWLTETIILPDVNGRPCPVASLPDARLRPLRGLDVAEDLEEGDVLPVEAETVGVGCRS
ncbi:hypothetical protein CF68_06915 [Cupriavidus sp. SK-4]|nr:hypothetical protein CF68_06915 [Cupriavidus sp. SK-4]